MPNEADILVIGAGPEGIVCALTARKYYPDKKIVVMRNVEKGVIPCGIPYMIKSLQSPDENILGMAALEKNGIEIDSPYDLENFAQDYLCDHSLIIKTGKFEYRDYED